MKRIILTKEDNNIIVNHLYTNNRTCDVSDRIAMDSYINYIDFIDNDIILNCSVIEVVPDDTVPSATRSISSIGTNFDVNLSTMHLSNIFAGAIREIQINKLIND